MTYLIGSHHVTLSVGGAQEDVDFHTRVLGLRFIKKTVLYDGSMPIYHFYYSNAAGDPSSVITTFPWRQAGIVGQRGTNQAREVLLSVPSGSLDYWVKRLGDHGVPATRSERFGRGRIEFRHPTGIEYVFVGNDNDPRVGYTDGGVPADAAVHGIHGVGMHVYDHDRMVDFASEVFFAQESIQEEGDVACLQVGKADHGNFIELTGNRSEDQGTWRYGEGTYHHFAWNLDTLQNQEQVKFDIEGAGYTDISELKNRTYFKSHYVRTPGGALFELAVTHEDGGWDCDESPEELGKAFMLPPTFESERESILARLEPVTTHAGR